MKIDINSLKKIAHLARLEFDEKSAEKMTQDMTQILDWVEQLNELETDGVEPITTMSSEVNVLREDSVADVETVFDEGVDCLCHSLFAPVLMSVCAIRGDETHRRDHKDDEGFKGHGQLAQKLPTLHSCAASVMIASAASRRAAAGNT